MQKIIYIVGIGGRTGAMFAREMGGSSDIIGVGLSREAKMIAAGDLKLSRGGAVTEALSVPVVTPENFKDAIEKKYPDFIWVATRNPVTEAVKFYYRNFAGRKELPALILSQNGLSAIDDAKAGLEAALGDDAGKVAIVRVSLINGVDMSIEDGVSIINYKVPVKLGFGAISGQTGLKDVLRATQIKFQEFEGRDVLKMENSKLFTNLIGMAAAARGMTVSGGLLDKKVFMEEVSMLKEYVVAVKAGGGGFLDNYAGYPIKMLAGMMLLPAALLVPFRGIFERIVTKGRNRPKDLFEIDYYNGEVVKLGKRFGTLAKINEAIVGRVKNTLPGGFK